MLECLDVVLGSRVRGEPILEDVISGSSTLKQGFPLEFYFRGHKSPLTFI